MNPIPQEVIVDIVKETIDDYPDIPVIISSDSLVGRASIDRRALLEEHKIAVIGDVQFIFRPIPDNDEEYMSITHGEDSVFYDHFISTCILMLDTMRTEQIDQHGKFRETLSRWIPNMAIHCQLHGDLEDNQMEIRLVGKMSPTKH